MLQSSIENEPSLFIISSANSTITWYQRIWAAVIRRAIVDYILYINHSSPKLRKIGIDAKNWIFSEESMDMSSFIGICDNLSLNYVSIREKILTLSEEDARKLRGMEFCDEELK